MCEFPEFSNLFCTLEKGCPKEIVSALDGEGWKVRMSGFSEFEAHADSAELSIEASSPVLIHGQCSNPSATAEILATLFRGQRWDFSIEVYNSNQELLSTLSK